MTMAGKYVDGFVVPVPKKNIDAYKASRRRPDRSGRSTARSNTSNASPTT